MHYIGNGIQYEIYSSVKHSIHFISLNLVHIEKQHIFPGSHLINSSTIIFQLEKDRHLYQHDSLTDFFKLENETRQYIEAPKHDVHTTYILLFLN